MADGYVQVAADGAGKQVDMDQTTTAAGATMYRQRAVLVGLTQEQLDELVVNSRLQLAVLRAILLSLNCTNSLTTEEDFLNV